MNIVFRVDSSIHMGIGHLMRSLTLADEMQKQNHVVTFVCRDLEGNLISLIKHPVLILPKNDEFQSNNFYLNWLGETQDCDAQQTIEVMPDNTDYLIVDNYALDEVWHKQLRPYTKKIMVIDDLANRGFECDILLNQNLSSVPEDYQGRVPYKCKLLLGCNYALLRREFSETRSMALVKRQNVKEVRSILVSMGGSDINNVTYDILQQLDSKFHIVVVLGSMSPHNDMIRSYAQGRNIEVVINANNMAELMLNADLAIGTSGSTNWERFCLGLPALVFIAAENQRKVTENLAQLGLIRVLKCVDKGEIRKKISSINDLAAWSKRCFSQCCCSGAPKVVEVIVNYRYGKI